MQSRKLATQEKKIDAVAGTTHEVAVKVEEVVAKVEEVHLATNSLTDRLVETTKSEAHAAGVKEEQERAKG